MEDANEVVIERSARFRKRLAELEVKRAQFGSDVPNEIWKELVEVSLRLDREERKAQAAGGLKIPTDQRDPPGHHRDAGGV